MNTVFFYSLTISFVLGIALGTFYDFAWPTFAWLLLVSFVLMVWYRRRSEASPAPFVALLSFCFIALAVGVLRVDTYETKFAQSLLSNSVGQEVTLEGLVIREPEEKTNSTQLILETNAEKVLVRADRYAGVNYGDSLIVTGKLSAPEPFETDLGRTFNYPGYLEARGVQYIVNFAEVEVQEKEVGNIFYTYIYKFKSSFISKLESQLVEPQSGLAQGLLLGVKQSLGEDLELAFRQTGIIHIVVLSGYNVMLVVTFVLYVLAFIFPFRSRIVVGLLAILTFAILVGFSPTVLRASIMASLLLVARYLGRTYQIVRGLVLAGIAMLLFNPYLLIYDVGFQLSFVATLGLLAFAPFIESKLSGVPKTVGVREFLTATIATQLFVTPLLLYQIGEFSVVAVIVNVIVLPMVPVAMLLAFFTGMLSFVSSALALPFAFLAHLSLTYIIQVSLAFAQLPFASYVVPAFPFVVVPLAYGLLALVWWRYAKTVVDDIKPVTKLHPTDSTSALANWTILNEEEYRQSLETKNQDDSGQRPESSRASEIPVFFR